MQTALCAFVGWMGGWMNRWITTHLLGPNTSTALTQTHTQGLDTFRPGQTHQGTQGGSFSFYGVSEAQRACPENESSLCQEKKKTTKVENNHSLSDALACWRSSWSSRWCQGCDPRRLTIGSWQRPHLNGRHGVPQLICVLAYGI